MGTKNLIRAALATLLLLFGHSTFATPTQCQSGSQDSTCVTRINNAYQVAPTCSSAAGWVTTQAAVWQGSKFSNPQCSYTAPPTCPTDPGWTTTASATWTGSSWNAPQCAYAAAPTCPSGQTTLASASWSGSAWVGLSCQPIAAIPPLAVCQGSLPAGYTLASWYSQWEYLPVNVHYQTSSVGNQWYVYIPPSLSSSSLVGSMSPSDNLSTTDTSFWLQLTGADYTAMYTVCGDNQVYYTANNYSAVCQVNPTTGQLDGWFIDQSPVAPNNGAPNCGAG